MNEFTKEELNFIECAMQGFVVKHPDLDGKIKSMIENYDENKIVSILQENDRILSKLNICFEGKVQDE